MSGVTPLLINLETILQNPGRVGIAKLHSMETPESRELYRFGKHGIFKGLRKRGDAGGEMPHKRCDEAISRAYPEGFERFQAFPHPRIETGEITVLRIQCSGESNLCIKTEHFLYSNGKHFYSKIFNGLRTPPSAVN